jgi:hypothetical protein
MSGAPFDPSSHTQAALPKRARAMPMILIHLNIVLHRGCVLSWLLMVREHPHSGCVFAPFENPFLHEKQFLLAVASCFVVTGDDR